MTMTSDDPLPTLPTSTIHAVRLCLYQATRRPRQLRGEIARTPWGIIKVTGRLGQQHADVMESICYVREKKATLEDGRIKLLVDPARVRQRARQTSGDTYRRVLDDLMSTVIEIVAPERLACVGHLIDHVDYARRSDGTPITRRNPLGGERHLWRVEIGKALCRLIAGDIWVGYDPEPIAALRHGISQAIARHILTHKTPPRGGWTLDGLIRAVSGGDVGAAVMRDRRRELRSDASALAEIGIIIEGDRLTRVDAGAWSKCAGGVEQSRDSVEQSRDSVEQSRGAWSKVAGLADTVSDTDTGAGG
jgi:hypothetical protein